MLVKFLGVVFVLLLLFGAVAYSSGWVSLQTHDNNTTVEVKTGEIKEAADIAIEKGKTLLDKADEKFKEFGEEKSADQN